MKKLLSIMLVLLMALSVFACKGTTPAKPDEPTEPDKPVEQPTEAPAEPVQPTEPDQPDQPAVEYEGLALNIKNKTGKTIDALYIYPAGAEDMGNSVVEPDWNDKEVDGENYEKNIYIVREKGVPMDIYIEFADHTFLKIPAEQVGTLAMYDKLSFKGPTADDLKHEPNDDENDKLMMDFLVARGKTDDNFYPGYELIPMELKNKTGKSITGMWFFEEGAKAEDYNNIVDYLYTDDGVKMDSLMSGKAKEGGKYLFKCFIRPHTDNYYLYVTFDDGTDITYPIEGWFTPDGDGHFMNEISLKNAEDKYDIKVQYDDGVPEPIDYLAESVREGHIVDQWYPTYAETTMDADTVNALRAALAVLPVPAQEEPADNPDEPGTEEPEQGAPEGYAIPEGFEGLALNVKNKTGKTITNLYIYDKPAEDALSYDMYAPIFEEPWLDKDADEANYEQNIYIIRASAEEYRVEVEFEDGESFFVDLPLKMYDKISLKGPTAEDVKHEANDDEADIAAMDALVEAGVPTDGHYPGAGLAEPPAGYTGLHLMLKNKSGKEIAKVYLFPNGEDKGKNIFKTVVEGNIPTEDESVEGKPHEVFAYVYRETAKLEAMTLRVRYADETEEDYELKPLEDYTVFTVKADEFKQKVSDDPEDIFAMDSIMMQVNGASTDGVEFEPIA